MKGAELNLEYHETGAPELRDNTLFHVGVSGGKDSVAALLWMVHESGIPRDKIVASFSDIGNDHEWTIKHIKLISETVHPIETIRPSLNFFELAAKKGRFPSSQARFCTEHLKIYPTFDHLQHLRIRGFDPIAVSGVRADESDDRRLLPEWDYNGYLFCLSWRPLISKTISDVFALHAKYGVPLNPLYAFGARRVGCWPCIMSAKAEIRNIELNFPERIDEIRAKEIEIGSSFFPPNVCPKRFHSMSGINKDGQAVTWPTIDDVVRWSMTGKRAKGSYLDDPPEPVSCQSGFCE